VSKLRLLLLGGAAAAGKSISGTEAARQVGLPCVSADSLWYALQAVTSRQSHAPFHYFEPTEEEWLKGPDFLCARHIRCAEELTPALEAFIDRELKEGHSMVFEGAWITPEMAARRADVSPETRAVFIHEPEESQILASMVARRRRHSPSQRQLRLAAMAWRYGNWLHDGARQHGLPVIEARPRETLTQRIIEASEKE
jgi:2-phosphoglycerate kinase